MLTFATAELRDQVFERARGACECTMQKCGHHSGRCPNSLGFSWELQRIEAGGPSAAANVMAICEQCYRNTPEYWESKKW